MIRVINILFFCGMLVMNYLANALPLNGKTTGELSGSFPNLFVPAGITFSIWGIIYILLFVFCILQFRDSNHEVVANISWYFSLSCLFNALWIVFWHYGKLPLSLFVMLGLLASLAYINILIRELPNGIIKASFGIYLGWICIATIANITALLVHYGWNRFGISEETWSMIMITAGALITLMTIMKLNNPFTGLSVIWAFTGIIIKRQHDYRTVVIVAGIALALVALITIREFLRKSMPLPA